MLMPSIFGEDLFDDLMDFPFERGPTILISAIKEAILCLKRMII